LSKARTPDQTLEQHLGMVIVEWAILAGNILHQAFESFFSRGYQRFAEEVHLLASGDQE